ncbi:MAG: nuclear transport factor 2 family protein [Acidimicrobiales bacterium]
MIDQVRGIGDDGRRFSRDEVDDAFRHLYRVGAVEEDFTAWARMFSEEATYVEHFWGTLHGRREIEAWINPVMAGVPEVYTVLEWYTVDESGRAVWYLQNRRDNPDPEGPAYFDFPGLSTARYAGDGLWDYEEDYWDVNGARETASLYAAAFVKMGSVEEQRLSRKHWPGRPAFARMEKQIGEPGWLGLQGLRRITKPRELREILASL